jgi:hypothetical protein
MSRLMRTAAPVVRDLPTVTVNARSLQKGSLNDPALQGGVLYFNAQKTNYLYLDGTNIVWQPANGSPITLN